MLTPEPLTELYNVQAGLLLSWPPQLLMRCLELIQLNTYNSTESAYALDIQVVHGKKQTSWVDQPEICSLLAIALIESFCLVQPWLPSRLLSLGLPDVVDCQSVPQPERRQANHSQNASSLKACDGSCSPIKLIG